MRHRDEGRDHQRGGLSGRRGRAVRRLPIPIGREASAGAIAAAVAAAAECGRASGATSAGSGFPGLAQFPDELTASQRDGRSLLFHLFRPQPGVRRLFDLLMTALPKPAPAKAVRGLVRRMLSLGAKAFPGRAWLGAALGILLVLLAVLAMIGSHPLHIVVLAVFAVIGLVLAVVGIAIGVLSGLLADIGRLSGQSFGLSSGQGEQEEDVALTPWLHGKLQQLAGESAPSPLTFADLRTHDIELRVMTTNLSRNEPLAVPWDNGIYFFDPAHFRTLFPAEIVEAMCAEQPVSGSPAQQFREQVLRIQAEPLRPFPRFEALPILVATRMSLSFPFLISAVPLFAADFTLPANQNHSAAVAEWRRKNPGRTAADAAVEVSPRRTFEKHWFSDGGLAANLPVHFFDSPLPTRPTFAIDLATFPAGRTRDRQDPSKNVYLPVRNLGGLHRRTADWEAKKPLSKLLSFAMSLVNTARVWVDERQLVMPGYRDRTVTVYLAADEGGLNLSMPKPVVDGLSESGQAAGRALKQRFAGPNPAEEPAAGWTNHRWLRFRSATGGLSEWLDAFDRAYPVPVAPTVSYDALLAGTTDPPSYPMTQTRREAAAKRIKELRTLITDWGAEPADAFTHKSPHPTPALRLTADRPPLAPEPAPETAPESDPDDRP